MSEKISRRVPVGKIGRQHDIPRFADGRPKISDPKHADEFLSEDARNTGGIEIAGLPTEKVDGEGDWRAGSARGGLRQARFRKE